MKYLSIGENFKLPLELVTSTQAILARKRSGKSYTASVEAEEMLELHQQIVVIDPTSAWYGLRSSADGEGPGYGVVVFGGERADAPLDFRSGKAMARAVVEHGFSAVFDIGDWITDEQIQFVYEFSSELLRVNRSAIHLFLDEADTFAPQLLESKEHKRCLGATSRLVKQGGIKGIGVTMITQRGADLNKKVLSQIDMLTVLRMSHPPDIKPVTDWISANISPAYAEEVAGSLPRLEVGEAFVCSGPRAHGERVKIRLRRTFNSGATPKPGERKISPKVLASIDIKKLGSEIQASIEKAKADDPAVLRQRITALEADVRRASQTAPVKPPIEMKADPEAIRTIVEGELRSFFDTAYKEIGQRLAGELEKNVERRRQEDEFYLRFAATLRDESKWTLKTLSGAGEKALRTVPMIQNSSPSRVTQPLPPAATPPRPQRNAHVPMGNSAAIPGPQRKVLNAIAWFESIGVFNPEQPAVAFLAGYSINSSSFGVPKSWLKAQGLIEYPGDGRIILTDAGRGAAEMPSISLSNDGLQGAVLAKLGGPERRLLEPLLKRYPQSISNDALAEEAGYSVSSSSYGVPRSRLKNFGLIEYPQPGMVRAKDLLFPEGR